MSWAATPKKRLTPHEVLMVAHAHLICGIDQHLLASMYGVNQGRVAEAVVVMRDAAERHLEIYRQKEKATS